MFLRHEVFFVFQKHILLLKTQQSNEEVQMANKNNRTITPKPTVWQKAEKLKDKLGLASITALFTMLVNEKYEKSAK